MLQADKITKKGLIISDGCMVKLKIFIHLFAPRPKIPKISTARSKIKLKIKIVFIFLYQNLISIKDIENNRIILNE